MATPIKESLIKCFWTAALLLLATGCVADKAAREEPQTVYTQPLLSQGALFGALPLVVQNTVRAQVGSAEISAIHRLTGENPLVYRVEFRRHEIYPPLLVSEDGAVLNPDFTVAVDSAAHAMERLQPD